MKIHINTVFSSNRMNDLSLEVKRHKHISSSSSLRSRSRSPSADRRVIISSSKTREEHYDQRAQREKYIREKELIFKRQSSSIWKPKHQHSSSNRRESKEEKLKRLFNQYSDEDMVKHWKPIVLDDCFELYQYAFKKYHRTH